MQNIFNHFQEKFEKYEYFCQRHNIFNQEGNLRPSGSVEVQEGNLRPSGSVEVQEGNLRPSGSVEVQEGNLHRFTARLRFMHIFQLPE